MKKHLYLTALFSLTACGLSAQVRYLDPVFDEVMVSLDVEYGENTSVLLESLGPIKIPLLMDVYQPAGDLATDRPLAIVVHAGNFLPPIPNFSYQGTMRDSAIVYLATQLAARGYVAAAISIRAGWNPLSPFATERRFTLVNALYRGIQDVNTCTRYFKKNAAAYGIDPEKILVWGDGSGGLLAFSAAALDSFEEWQLPQFIMPDGTPMVDPAINGDIWATSVGVVPAGYPYYNQGDTLCFANHVGYQARIKMAISMNGGVVDTAWMDTGEAALIAFHALPDPFMPYDSCGSACLPGGLLIAEPIVRVCGDLRAVAHANELGNNEPFVGHSFSGDFSEVANMRNEGVDGLFPLYSIVLSDQEVGYPWQWWDESLGPNNTTAEAAKAHLDTMLAYMAPRACRALGLYCPGVTAAEEPAVPMTGLQIFPSPASDCLTVRLENGDGMPGRLEVHTLDGRSLVRQRTSGSQTSLDLGGLPPGLYIIHWRQGSQVAVGRVVRL